MSELQATMDQLLEIMGEEVTVYTHQGTTDEGDDFWISDAGHSGSGTTYTVILEDTPSEEVLERSGFADEADTAIWAEEDICNVGDKITHRGRDYIVKSISDFWGQSDYIRQLIGVESMEA